MLGPSQKMFATTFLFFPLKKKLKNIPTRVLLRDSLLAVFVSHCSILALCIFSPIILLLHVFSYLLNQDRKSNVLLPSFDNDKATADYNLLSIIQHICWACITAATQIHHLLLLVGLKHKPFTWFLSKEELKYFIFFPLSMPQNWLEWQVFAALQNISRVVKQCSSCCLSRGFLQMSHCSHSKKTQQKAQYSKEVRGGPSPSKGSSSSFIISS